MCCFRANTNVVFCPKYRRPVLMPPIDVRLKELIQHACDETQSGLIEMEVMPGHVHLLLDCDPRFGIHRLVRGIKDRTSRVLRQEFRVLRTRLPTLWTDSYFVSAVGGAPLAVIKQFIENHKPRQLRRQRTGSERRQEGNRFQTLSGTCGQTPRTGPAAGGRAQAGSRRTRQSYP
jgi:putative transposase